MTLFENAGTKIFAAISALTVSAIFMATAIAPASQTVTGILA